MRLIFLLNDNLGVITAIVGVFSILAIWRGPIESLRSQKKIENYNERMGRKLNIFKKLMATRAVPVSFEHVQALNMIDIEFYDDDAIISAWDIYRDHLNSYPQNATELAQEVWSSKGVDYLADLLFAMAKLLGYSFDKILLKKGAYFPIAHDLLNAEQAAMRRFLVELLYGDRTLKIELVDKKIVNDKEVDKTIKFVEKA